MGHLMNRFFGASTLALAIVGTFAVSPLAQAGDKVLYQQAPDWVLAADVDMEAVNEGPSEALLDWQYRLQDGVVHEYSDRIVRIDNLESLTSEGTLQMDWAPDKGDLTIHRLEIHRDGEIIDLVEEGAEFEVLRREQGLEQRLLDGRLTATLAVPGLEEGDVLRVTYSITVDDQALGDEMQALQYLPPEPYRVGKARTVFSWPEGEAVSWRTESGITVAEPVLRNGFRYLSLDLPIAKREDMPMDAPSRFSRATIMRVGTFDSWEELSRVMEPHFTKAATLGPDSKVAIEASRIMKQTSDPLKRTELAVRLVQDQVSYLLNGLDGGNYLPQTADDTWEKRYGDCKAKSVLLLAILRHMGITADVVLVATDGGDALPELLPLPANFDHMIVRATVDGTDYWLDGTSTATRLNNMAKNPPFFYALPLTAQGTGLAPIVDRAPPIADMDMHITFDHRAGVDLPTLYRLEMRISGPASEQIEAIVDEADPETKKQMLRNFSGGSGNGMIATAIDFGYDEEQAIGTIVVNGVGEASFDFDQGKLKMDLAGSGKSVGFSPNRVRPKWRDIPVQTNGPSRNHSTVEIILPNQGEGFRLEGNAELDAEFANSRLIRKAALSGDRISVETQQIATLGEIPFSALADEKRKALRAAKSDLFLFAPDGTQWRWDNTAQELANKTAAALKGYNLAVAEADDDDFGPLQSRARFFTQIYDYENALKDFSAVIDEEPNANLFLSRADIYEALGRMDDAIADVQSAYELSPDNETAYWQAKLTARAGRHAEAIELLDLLPVSDDEMDGMVDARSIVLGLAGQVENGLAVLDERLGERTDSSDLLNSDCWFRGLHKVALDSAVAQCTRAIERSRDPSNVLDSRAMVHYRRGDLDSALADLDAALKLNPGLAPTRYLRGIILLEKGQAAGKAQVEAALRQAPQLKAHYALYGITPKL